MKKQLSLLITCGFLSLHAIAQKMEYAIQLNSGVSVFRGVGAESSTGIYLQNYTTGTYRTNYDYGNQQQISYGLSGDAKFITKSNFVLGLQVGYEILRSKIGLQGYYPLYFYPATSLPYILVMSYPQGVAGSSTLTRQFVNLNPYIGYRVRIKQVAIDLTPGLDIAIAVHSQQKGQTATYNTPSNTITNDNVVGIPKFDTRLRFDMRAMYHKFGLSIGYSYGLSNYNRNEPAALADAPTPLPVYSDVVRIGLSCRIR